MQRWIGFLCLLCGACGDSPPTTAVVGQSCEQQKTLPLRTDPKVDVLVVLDDSPAMEPWLETLAIESRQMISVLINVEGGLPSIHLGVVSADPSYDGRLRVSEETLACIAGPSDAFFSDLTVPWWQCSDDEQPCRVRNYAGSLSDGFACATTQLGSAGAPSQAPFAMAARALADQAGNQGFRRSDAFLLVVVISASDDASSGPVASYLDQLTQEMDPSRLLFGVVSPLSAERLRSLESLHSGRTTLVDINDSWTDALIQIGDLSAQLLGVPCLEGVDPTDIDEEQLGIQLPCSVEVTNGFDPGFAIPACEMVSDDRPAPSTELPCYWVNRDQAACGELPELRVEAAAGLPPGYEAKIRCECAEGERPAPL